MQVNSLQNDKKLDKTKLRGFADDNKRSKNGDLFSKLSPFPTMFSNNFILRVVKTGDCLVKGKVL